MKWCVGRLFEKYRTMEVVLVDAVDEDVLGVAAEEEERHGRFIPRQRNRDRVRATGDSGCERGYRG